MGKKEQTKKDNSKLRWVLTVSIITFILSIFFSFVANNAISRLGLIPAILILILVIFMGIVSDFIGVAVTIAPEEEFHAKASKKVDGSKESIKLIRNSAKVANLTADVIGDIAGVLSGAASALIVLKITESLGIEFDLQILVSAIVASLTVGGKAIGKQFAENHATEIVHVIGVIMSKFKRK